MAKFTDGFFTFPIKIYDGVSLQKHLNNGELLGSEDEPDWVSGSYRIPADELNMLSWYDGFSRGRSTHEVLREGFDLTIVYSPNLGELTCTWTRKEFERKLNEFVDKLNIQTEDDLVL